MTRRESDVDRREGVVSAGGRPTVVAVALTAGLLGAVGAVQAAPTPDRHAWPLTKPLSHGAYAKRVAAIGTRLTTLFYPLAYMSRASASDDALAVKRLRKELSGLEKELAAISPPSRVSTEHARLVAAVDELVRQLGPVITQLNAGDKSALNSINSLTGVSAIDAAAYAIEQAGYRISG